MENNKITKITQEINFTQEKEENLQETFAEKAIVTANDKVSESSTEKTTVKERYSGAEKDIDDIKRLQDYENIFFKNKMIKEHKKRKNIYES